MKTVGDFKRSGLMFVEADKVENAVSGELYTENTNSGFCLAINHRELYDSDLAHSFAWRANTGVKPEFAGVIQVQYRDGESKVWVHPNNTLRWLDYDRTSGNCFDDDITKWRPHLPSMQAETTEEKAEEEVKPIYTQAMCDAGEFPPVGCYAEIAESTDYVNISYERGKRVKVYAHFTSDRGTELAAFVSDDHLCGGVAIGECFKPIQTQQEKTIESAAKVLREYESGVTELVRGLDMFIGPATALFKAGLLK